MELSNLVVQVNGQPKELHLGDEVSFDKIIETINEETAEQGTSITNVKLNGEDITGKDWERFAHLNISDIRNLEVETGNMKKLALDTLNSLIEFTINLVIELKRVTELFRMGNAIQGGDIFSRAIDGIQLVNHASAMVERNLRIDTGGSQGNGNSLTQQLNNLQPILEDMFSSQQDQDWVLLADLLEYELIPHFEERVKLLKSWLGSADILSSIKESAEIPVGESKKENERNA